MDFGSISKRTLFSTLTFKKSCVFTDIKFLFLLKALFMKTAKLFSRLYVLIIFFLIGLTYSAHTGGAQVKQFGLLLITMIAMWIFHVVRMKKKFTHNQIA